ncbi:hypothetical protein O181_008254 [Austropuccinia psidii MF-1]|uniref:Uncharacterized protein n=1 Tax=Austropuccinia psidii MF-1 TaxID=1389203 RepID=A0A9Q3BMA8_9BASI|nr:hypothetical protein [Austropuccinia psidii MF-1]
MPKHLTGGHELLLTHQELSGSEKYHRTFRRLEPIVLQRQAEKDKELVEKSNSFIHRPEEGVGNDPSFGERRPSGVYQLQKCPRRSPKDLRRNRKVSRTIREKAKSKQYGTDLTHKGTGSPDWNLQLWTVSSIWPEPHVIHSKGEVKDEQDFSVQIIQEIQFVKTSINVELGKIDERLTKITLDINELKKNDRHSSEWYKSTIAKLDSMNNICNKMETKCQVQDDEIGDISISHINE